MEEQRYHDENVTWEDLLEFLTELKEIDPKEMNGTVCMVEHGGSEAYAYMIKRDKFNKPYLKCI